MKETSPRFINVVAQNNGLSKNPCINGILDPTLNAYEITIFDGKRMNNFYIFFSPTKSIRVNQAVRSLTMVTYWTGDILIMRGGVRAKGVVNMRGHDAKLADFALKR